MISLFTKRDVSSQPRDEYGRWTNADTSHAYVHWKTAQHLKHLGTIKALAQDAHRYAGRRGELLRRKIYSANAKEFLSRGLDKEKSQRKRLNSLFDIHQANMSLVDHIGTEKEPSEQSRVRAAIFAHAVQYNQGPFGRLTPAYRAMIMRRVKAAVSAEDAKMSAAVAVKPGRKAKVAKFNQDHDELGRFTGPGGSHDPTGNPRGRPPGHGAEMTTGQRVGQAALGIAGGALGGYAGATLAGAAGGAIGGPVGALIGGKAGQYAGSVLGSLAGDYVAAKIGESLLGIKETMDGHPIGQGEAIGTLAGAAAPLAIYGAAHAIPGGAAAASLFSPTNQSLASHAVEETIGGLGVAAGQEADRRAAGAAGKAAGGAVRKGLFDAPPKSYDGSFGSIAAQSPPHLFGPRAWSKISGTPFGAYVRQKVKETADKMDDAAEAKGIGLRPAPPRQIGVAHQVVAEEQQRQAEAERQRQLEDMAAQAAATRPPPPGGAKKPGGDAKKPAVKKSVFDRPRLENMAQKPGEGDQEYNNRVKRLLAQSVRDQARNRPKLFAIDALGGEFGQKPVYRVRKVRESQVAATEEAPWRIEAEIAKEFQTEDRLKQGLVWGWASVIEKGGKIVTDHQGDRIAPDELVKAAHDFVSNSRKGGVLHDEHGHHIGRIVESVVFTHELQKALGIDLGKVGWLIGYKVEDPRAKMMVNAGLLKSFSIGGRGKREPVQDAA